MHILQFYQIPLTITTFVNYYRRLSLLKLNNQALWLSDKTAINVGNKGYELLNLCCDARLFIFNGLTPGDKSEEFTSSVNGGRNIVDYITASLLN